MTRFVLISDTHLTTPELPGGDVLIHAGDLTMRGTVEEFQESEKWFRYLSTKFPVIYYVPGNHDWLAFTDQRVVRGDIMRTPRWLVDEEVYVGTTRIYGCPWTKTIDGHRRWAFPLYGGTHSKEKWAEIPEALDILITHGPPKGVSDIHFHTGCELGDEYQAWRFEDLVKKPVIHVFGHIHSGQKITEKDGILHLNASICDEQYRPTQHAIVLDYKPGMKPVVELVRC